MCAPGSAGGPAGPARGRGEPRRRRRLHHAAALARRCPGSPGAGGRPPRPATAPAPRRRRCPRRAAPTPRWVRVAKRRGDPLAQLRPAGLVVLVRQVVAGAEQADELGVELRLQRADRQVPAVGGRVDVVERRAGVEQVHAALVAPAAGGAAARTAGSSDGRRRRRSPRRPPGRGRCGRPRAARRAGRRPDRASRRRSRRAGWRGTCGGPPARPMACSAPVTAR